MASGAPALLLLTAALFALAAADRDCKSYFTSSGLFKPEIDCSFIQFCCGDCDNRYCCSDVRIMLTEDAQDNCIFNHNLKPIALGVSVSIVILIVLFVLCCCCPFCCLYKMCRKPRPVIGTTTTVVTQYPQQQPVSQGGQYPPYQTMPAQPGYGGQPAYGGQPMPTGPYQGQPYAPGPPPPYQEAGGPGYPVPYSQAAYDGGQAMYPTQPPVQPGYAHLPPPTDYTSAQPPYNPAYTDPPKTGY